MSREDNAMDGEQKTWSVFIVSAAALFATMVAFGAQSCDITERERSATKRACIEAGRSPAECYCLERGAP